MERGEFATPAVLRPYQLLCVVCYSGEEQAGGQSEKLRRVREAVREDPDMPITLVCNVGDVYLYQDPGTAEDSPEGADYNRKRDLDILHLLALAPGSTLPARALFLTLLKRVASVRGICGYDTLTGTGWECCPRAASGAYEKAHERGIDAFIPPRTQEEMAIEKRESLAVLYSAEVVPVRPHILMCAVCQYGGGTRPPYPEDNLPELLELILNGKPDLLIRMARGADWMMCAPCPKRVPTLNACVHILGSCGLSNEKRDLDMLQKLGLHFGSTMKARDLFHLILERIPTTQEICRRDEACVCPSVWWDTCGESNRAQGSPNYEKGRVELLAKLGLP